MALTLLTRWEPGRRGSLGPGGKPVGYFQSCTFHLRYVYAHVRVCTRHELGANCEGGEKLRGESGTGRTYHSEKN